MLHFLVPFGNICSLLRFFYSIRNNTHTHSLVHCSISTEGTYKGCASVQFHEYGHWSVGKNMTCGQYFLRKISISRLNFRCLARMNINTCRQEDERRVHQSLRRTGALNFLTEDGIDLLDHVKKFMSTDNALDFFFF